MRQEQNCETRKAGPLVRRLIRGTVIFNFIFYLIYWLSPQVGVLINSALRNLHLYNAAYYWFNLSTVALPILLVTEIVKRYIEGKRLKSQMDIGIFDPAIFIDLVLVAVWIIAVLWAVAYGAAAI